MTHKQMHDFIAQQVYAQVDAEIKGKFSAYASSVGKTIQISSDVHIAQEAAAMTSVTNSVVEDDVRFTRYHVLP
jgi:hypothetical protein